MAQFTAVSLFCGAGGLDIGFEQSCFKVIFANDIDKDSCDTYRQHSGAVVVQDSIGNLLPSEIPHSDVILGGFPCQGFSLSGPRKIDDKRNGLYHHYVQIVREKQPKAFVGENVKGLLSMDGGRIFEAIVQEFSECGYHVFSQLVNAKDYDVPQDRQRIIIVGFRKDLGVNSFSLSRSGHSIVTLGKALKNEPICPENDVCDAPYSSRYMSRNRKRGWDEVSFTIPAMAKQVPLWPGSPDMVKIDKDLWKFGDGFTRRLSVTECGLIQTFPKDMMFCGNIVSRYRQIGNAVPCNLARYIAQEVGEVLHRR